MLNIEPIAAFSDNYIWLITADNNPAGWVVDPGEAAPVLERLEEKSLTLEGVLLTHHHFDHDGGIAELKRHYPDLVVAGSANTQSEHPTETFSQGDCVTVLGETFSVMEIPGHTLDHIAFYCANDDRPLLFCGDTLFAGGCGRVFEGTFPQMHQSLLKLTKLPSSTACYCAHEYTTSNLDFALAVEPDNQALLDRIDKTRQLRASNTPTVPSTLSLELETNPFLRSDAPEVVKAAEKRAGKPQDSDADVFAVIRQWKDSF